MEEKVYLCGWSNNREGWTLWTKEAPNVRVTGATYAEAEERLISAVQDHGGAMVVVMEFIPPLPADVREARYCTPELYLVCGDDRFETDEPRVQAFATKKEIEARLDWLDQFFSVPVCRQCKRATGPRSDRPITLTYAPSKGDGAFGSLGGTSIQIVSEEFVELLTDEERGRIQLRATERKGRRRFYEITGPSGPTHVAVAGLAITGWRCKGCRQSRFGYWGDGLKITNFVAAADLPSPLPCIFTVGSAPEIALCVTGVRWAQMLGKKGTRGFVSRRLGIVPPNEVIREPSLQER